MAKKKLKVVFWGALLPSWELYCPHFLGVQTGLKRMGCEFLFLCCRSDFDYIKKTIEFKPDLVISGLPDPIKQWLPLENVKHKLPRTKIVFWYGDLRTEKNNKLQQDCRGLLDMMFVSNDGQRRFWQKNLNIKEVHFLPLACEPIKKPIYNKKFAFDKVFIGSKNYAGDLYKRALMINDLEKFGVKRIDSQFPETRAKIYMNMPAIYSSSKICLDVSHYTDIQGYTSVRYWEIPAFWGFALTKRFPGCEEFYPESIRAYFDTTSEALDKIDYYLTHEEERMKMVEAAHEHSYQHTHKERFKQMFKILGLSTF